MSPTCSKSDLAGRKALSTAVLTIYSSWTGGAASAAPHLSRHEVYAMKPAPATHNLQAASTAARGRGFGLQSAKTGGGIRRSAWYGPRALRGTGEESRRPRLRRAGAGLVVGSICVAVAGCGGGGARQD